MLFGGIDWSDSVLDFHLRTADGKVLAQGEVQPSVEGLADLFTALETHAQPDEIGIAIETSHGAWVQALLDRGYKVYPVNPKTVERFREALSAAGDKSDKIDRKVLAMFLATFHQDNKPLRPDATEIISLRIACQDRLRIVEERTAKLNELGAILKCYYPAVLGLFGHFKSYIALDFLLRFPTQNKMQALSERRFRSWLKRHHYPRPQRIDDMVDILERPALSVAEHLQKSKEPLICYLAGSIKLLNAEITERNKQITEQLNQLPEANWICSLPGAGEVLAPSLLACLGRDPQRFASAADARAFMGTAPVTKASGNYRSVHFRRGCWKFARRTLQLFADKSRHQCAWAQVFYEKQRNSGHNHHAALRALAHKWLKIILAMRRTGTLYNEQTFTNSQRRYLLKVPILTTKNSNFLIRA
ncbi:MAG TPA: IS110 family transposase [Sedimentisphaerales bacterium]|nr:IS110 family transposase [Sedimentisphaerales bacterium]